MGRRGHRCGAAHCWSHDSEGMPCFLRTWSATYLRLQLEFHLPPVNFNSSAPLLLRVQPASDQRKTGHSERNLQAYRGTNKIVTVVAVSRSRYPMSRALRSNTGTS
jgi:hypothetical protein